MPYYLNIVCDHESKNCRIDKDGNPSSIMQSVGFDDVNEKFQDVLDSISGEGWTVTGESPEEFRFYCPVHSKTD